MSATRTPPTVLEVATLLAAAQKVGGPLCATLELCVLTLAMPSDVVQIDVEKIDWEAGHTIIDCRDYWREPARRILALPPAAVDAVLRIAGSPPRHGQVVTSGNGRRLKAKDVRLARLRSLLARKSPETAAIDWDFRGVRRCGVSVLAASHTHLIGYVFGEPDRSRFRWGPEHETEMALEGLEIWHRALRKAGMSAHIDRS